MYLTSYSFLLYYIFLFYLDLHSSSQQM